MYWRHITLVSAAALIFSSSAVAQPAGTLEFGAYGAYTSFGDLVLFDDAYGGGGRLGFFLLPRLEIEGSATYTVTQEPTGLVGDISYLPIRASLLYNQPFFGPMTLIFGASYIRNQYGVNGSWTGDNGYGGLLGLRMRFSHRLAFRVDGTANYLPDLSDLASTYRDNTNLAVDVGFSLMFGKGGYGGSGWDDFVAQESQVQEVKVAAVDSDADGVLDDQDRCPGSATSVTVDGGGCAVALETNGHDETNGDMPSDSDADGVPDAIDHCPSSVLGATVDSNGCAVASDSDGDGVVDLEDSCPTTAPGIAVDATGCQILFEENVTRVTLQGVTFASGKWELTPNAQYILNGVAESLRANPSLRIEIAGYTDSTGSRRKNIWLSQTRAESVKLYLTQRGIARERMLTRGFGPDDPVASNDTPEGRDANRRVEVHRLDAPS